MANQQVKGLLSQLRAAADGIKAQIHELDDQISALENKRRALTETPVSKADLMEYVRADIQRRAASYQSRLEKWARESNFPFSYTALERNHLAGKQQPFPYLDGDPRHDGGSIVHMEIGGIFWNFGELFAEQFSNALDKFEFPADAVPVADRRRMIAEIDTELQKLNVKRDELANDLLSSGMYE